MSDNPSIGATPFKTIIELFLPTVEMMSEMVICVKQLWQVMKFTCNDYSPID